MLTDNKPRIPVVSVLLHGLWPSFLKCLIYRLRGYRIGKGVKLGFGSIISAKRVEIGDCTSIGLFTIFRGNTLCLGRHVSIGSGCFFDTPHVEIGEGTKINEQVFVGGLQSPDSRLKIGRNCQIMQMTFINPAISVTMGDDTGVGGHCLIFGHYSWLSAFEGYPTDFRPVEIGRSVAIAWRVFIGAGARIGDGATIGANSLVNHVIPPRCLASGSPARVVARAPYFPSEISELGKSNLLKKLVAEMQEYFRGWGFSCREDGSLVEVREVKRRWFLRTEKIWRFSVLFDQLQEAGNAQGHLVLCLRQIPDRIRTELVQRKQMWIDLERKERSDFGNDLGEEVVQYLKRYGVRLFRVQS